MPSLPEELVARFRCVSSERVERIEAGWQALMERRERSTTIAEVRRDLHTLKGDAHVTGFAEVDLLAHELEDLLEFAIGSGFSFPQSVDVMMVMGLHFLTMLLMSAPGVSTAGIDLKGFLSELREVQRDARIDAERGAALRSSPRSASGGHRLDQLSDSSREMLTAAATNVFLERACAMEGPARDRLEVTWLMLRSIVANVTAVRLQPRLHRRADASAALARALGKEVNVTVSCGDLTATPEAANALDVALMHLLTNATDHAIETPARRAEAGKAAGGTIAVVATDRGAFLELTVADDGVGIDFDRLRSVAKEKGARTPEECAALTEQELLELLFEPSFSTSTVVTQRSGRGIGLDAVRAVLEERGGAVSVGATAKGSGTTFVVRVPSAGEHVMVHTFRVPGSSVTLAASAEWSATLEPAGARIPVAHTDVLGALDIPATNGGGDPDPATRILSLTRGAESFALTVCSAVTLHAAERLCRTADHERAEVVRVDGTEAVLIRPELLRPSGNMEKAQ